MLDCEALKSFDLQIASSGEFQDKIDFLALLAYRNCYSKIQQLLKFSLDSHSIMREEGEVCNTYLFIFNFKTYIFFS